MKKSLLSAVMLSSIGTYAQVGINTTTPKAMLEVEYKTDLPATTNQSIGLPRVSTEQRKLFENVEVGQMIWNTTKQCLEVYNGYDWVCSNENPGKTVVIDGKTIHGVGSDRCLKLVKDRNYDDPDHKFIYCEIEGPDGKKWLSNNLGADYANINMEIDGKFDPTRQATSVFDKNAFGSLFQWQRKADGHELMDWKTKEKKNGITTEKAESWYDAGTNKSIRVQTPPYSWVKQLEGPFDLWTKGGPDGNNPCPEGYRVPSNETWIEIWINSIGLEYGKKYKNPSAFFNAGNLKLTSTGYYDLSGYHDNGLGYWTSDKCPSEPGKCYRREALSNTLGQTNKGVPLGESVGFWSVAYAVRCVQD